MFLLGKKWSFKGSYNVQSIHSTINSMHARSTSLYLYMIIITIRNPRLRWRFVIFFRRILGDVEKKTCVFLSIITSNIIMSYNLCRHIPLIDISSINVFHWDVILTFEPCHTQMWYYLCRIHDHFRNTCSRCNNDSNWKCHMSILYNSIHAPSMPNTNKHYVVSKSVQFPSNAFEGARIMVIENF